MRRDQRFVFEFTVSDEFARLAPKVAAQFIEAHKQEIAERVVAYGPRGGAYRLFTPPDRWRAGSDDGYDAFRGLTRWQTRRWGRYIRPSRVPFADAVTFRTFTIPVVDGKATLPDGRIIVTDAQAVDVPVIPGGFR